MNERMVKFVFIRKGIFISDLGPAENDNNEICVYKYVPCVIENDRND